MNGTWREKNKKSIENKIYPTNSFCTNNSNINYNMINEQEYTIISKGLIVFVNRWIDHHSSFHILSVSLWIGLRCQLNCVSHSGLKTTNSVFLRHRYIFFIYIKYLIYIAFYNLTKQKIKMEIEVTIFFFFRFYFFECFRFFMRLTQQ